MSKNIKPTRDQELNKPILPAGQIVQAHEQKQLGQPPGSGSAWKATSSANCSHNSQQGRRGLIESEQQVSEAQADPEQFADGGVPKRVLLVI